MTPIERVRLQQRRASRSWPEFLAAVERMKEREPELYSRLSRRDPEAVRRLGSAMRGRIHIAPWLLDQYDERVKAA